ncbi:MAG TPA: tetratricopeptide repeat protein [Roseiflexaceae bacterium]|nr:tetratricopeptide repeat protein [Roseiflexaceae bacterium]
MVGGQSLVVGQYAAVALFAERARAANPTFALTDANAASVAAICVRLDGLPLAIELAAARSKLFEPQAMLARLSNRLDFLATTARNQASRQQTLRATIDWSYNLLTADEQVLFARLAVFAGQFSLDAAEAVAAELRIENEELKNSAHDQNLLNSQFSILNLIESLVNQSMVRQVGAAGSEAQPHFRLMLTLREYAWERLERRGEAEALRRRHADFFLHLAEQAELELTGPRQQVWFARLTLQHDNLRAALAWSLERPGDGGWERGIRLVGALARFWWMRGHVTEGRRWLAAALQQSGSPRDTAAHAKALNWAGILAWSQGDLVAARALHEESLTLQRALGNQRGIAHSLNNLGIAATKQGDYATARALHEESLALRRTLDDPVGIAASLSNLGEVVARQGDYATARAYLAESLTLQRAMGDQLAVGVALNHLGEVADRQGQGAEARALYEESLVLERTLGYREGVAISLGGLGRVAVRQGSYAAALKHYVECLALWAELGGKDGIALCLEGIACVAVAQAQVERAARLFGAAEALRIAIGAPMSPADISFVEPFLSTARARLDAAELSAAWAAGVALALDQAVSAALQGGTAG